MPHLLPPHDEIIQRQNASAPDGVAGGVRIGVRVQPESRSLQPCSAFCRAPLPCHATIRQTFAAAVCRHHADARRQSAAPSIVLYFCDGATMPPRMSRCSPRSPLAAERRSAPDVHGAPPARHSAHAHIPPLPSSPSIAIRRPVCPCRRAVADIMLALFDIRRYIALMPTPGVFLLR